MSGTARQEQSKHRSSQRQQGRPKARLDLSYQWQAFLRNLGTDQHGLNGTLYVSLGFGDTHSRDFRGKCLASTLEYLPRNGPQFQSTLAK